MPLLQQMTMFVSVVGPIAGLVAAIVMLWHRDSGVGVGWVEVGAMLAMYALTAYGVTIGYHRLLTHRAFETYRPIKLLLATFASMGGQGAAIRWCATHRRHHQAADLDGDPHSPHVHGDGAFDLLRGMWHAHMGWLFHRDVPDSAKSVRDLLADPMLLLIDKLYFPLVIAGVLIPGAIIGLCTQSWYGFWSGVVWGGLVRICLLQHVTWCINSVCHVWGTRPFNSSDHSTNNLIFAVLAMGEGWHNNHHAFPTSARHGLRWWQFDSSWLIIFTLSKLGLAWNVRVPSESAMQAKSVKMKAA
jgi:stearoyl-CoA desaturase (delta-9 desaturase)